MLEEFLRLFTKSARLDLVFEIETKDDAEEVALRGPDDSILLARNAEVLHALEYICNKVFEKQGRKIILDCNGTEPFVPKSYVLPPSRRRKASSV